MARVGKTQGMKPFMASRFIKRGRRKGMYELTLTNGRTANGEIIPGQKVIVNANQIIMGGGECLR